MQSSIMQSSTIRT